MKDLYTTLGVDRSAEVTDIKRAFRKITIENHPDKHPGDTAAEDRFKSASQAYDVLGDKDKRKLYDEFGEMSLTSGFDAERARAYKSAGGGFGGGQAYPSGFGSRNAYTGFSNFGDARGTNFDDLLSKLFGGGSIHSSGNMGTSRSRKGQDISGEIEVTLLDSLIGVTVPLRVDTSGGKIKTLDVVIPRGAPDGAKLRLRGQGAAGSPPGDILLKIKIKPGQHLERKGNNLHMKLAVTALEAYRGDKIDVETPWGTVTMSLPPGSQNGATFRLRGKGVQRTVKGTADHGDLYVRLDLRMPAPGDNNLLDALDHLQADQNVREGLQFS